MVNPRGPGDSQIWLGIGRRGGGGGHDWLACGRKIAQAPVLYNVSLIMGIFLQFMDNNKSCPKRYEKFSQVSAPLSVLSTHLDSNNQCCLGQWL
jgi:hypothetical protein